MIAKWYRGYQVMGRRETYIDRVSNLVRQNDLGGIIPCLHTERLQRRQRQFYLFIGFNTEQKGDVPPRVAQLLDSITIGHYVDNFEYAQIKSMVSAGIDTEHYTRTIAYRSPVFIPAEDPLDLSDLAAHTGQLPTSESILAINRMLYWLSATGAGSWPIFRRVCDLLTTQAVGLDAKHIFRRLRLLGYVEYTARDGSKWAVCPPALVQSSGSNRYFLAGQRTPQLLKALHEATKVEELRQPTGQAPDIVQLQFSSPDEAQHLINAEKIRAICVIQWAGSAALKLADILPDLAGYMAHLPTVSGFAESNFSLHRWTGQGFVEGPFERATGMYRLHPHDPKSLLPPRTLFFDATQNCWQAGPWYDLRYLAQRAAGEVCRVMYNHSRQWLSIPANYRWPDLYERALILASGFLPLPSPDNDWFYFSDISPQLAHTLARKLNAVLEEKS